MNIDPLTRHAEQAGFAHVVSDMVYDAEQERPRLLAALEPLCPDIRGIMSGLRRRIPVAPNAATGVMGKMISLQSIAVAVAATGMASSDEGRLFRITLKHSIILALFMAVVTMIFAYVLPQFVPQV